MLFDYMALISEGKDDYNVTELYYDAETDVWRMTLFIGTLIVSDYCYENPEEV